MLSLYEILKANKTGIAPDMWTALAGRGGADSGHEVKELTGIPPLSFTADGTPLLDYLISGNTVQNGTPTPSNPADVNGVGVRTENLFDNDNFIDGGVFYPDAISSSLVGSVNTDILLIPCKPSTQYTVSRSKTTKRFMICFTTTANLAAGTPVYNLTGSAGYAPAQAYVLTAQSGADSEYLLIYYAKHAGSDSNTAEEISASLASMMVNEGSTAKPYEPYGYKIPISSAGVTTNIYLGSTQTTRQIKKLVLTGQETGWTDATFSGNHFFLSPALSGGAAIYIGALSTHYIPSNVGGAQRPDNSIRQVVYATVYSQISIRDDAHTALTDFKAFLQQQYAAGTPVTVWYVLTTPETAAVNEPLMKIGGYADTLSMEQAGVSIPTLNGQTVVDVETMLKPSQMYIKYQQ